MNHVTSLNPNHRGATKWRRLGIAIAIAALTGCASPEVMEYRSAPGAEVLVGKGGAVKTVEGVEVWFNGGTPPRAFKIIAEAKTDYQTALPVTWEIAPTRFRSSRARPGSAAPTQ